MRRRQWFYTMGAVVSAFGLTVALYSKRETIYSKMQELQLFDLAFLLHNLVAAAVGMEYYSRYAHGSVWHNPASILYDVHLTHHAAKKTPLEVNDMLGISNFFIVIGPLLYSLFAPPSLGTFGLLGLTAGISVFGTGYFIFHDGVYHRRFPTFGLENTFPFTYFEQATKLHALHHTQNMGPPYGFFLAQEEVEYIKRGLPPPPMPMLLRASLLAGAAGTIGALVTGN